jgi:hypothetical protein
VGVSPIVIRNGFKPFLPVSNFVYAALQIEIADGFRDLSARELGHYFLECRILLPDNFIQTGSPHSCLLHLLVRASCFNRFVLADIAY